MTELRGWSDVRKGPQAKGCRHLCACCIIFCIFEIFYNLKCFQMTSAWPQILHSLLDSPYPPLANISG